MMQSIQRLTLFYPMRLNVSKILFIYMANEDKEEQPAYATEMYARPSEREDPFVFE